MLLSLAAVPTWDYRAAVRHARMWTLFLPDRTWRGDPGCLMHVMRVRHALGGTLAAGWHVCEIHTAGLVAPGLMVDFGDGFEPVERVNPALARSGRHRFVIAFGSSPLSVAVASADPAVFDGIQRVRLRPVSRARAALELLRSALGVSSLPDIVRTVATAAAAVATGAVRGRRDAGALMLDLQRDMHRRAATHYADWSRRFSRGRENAGATPGRAAPAPMLAVVVLPESRHRVERTLASLVAQGSAQWRLYLPFPASGLPRRREWLERAAKADPRICLVPAGGESAGARLAAAIELIDAPWVACVPEGDRLATDAVATAIAVAKQTGARMVYADHDFAAPGRPPHTPHFKPAWGIDLWLAPPVLAGLTLVDTRLVKHRACTARTAWGAWYDVLLQALDEIEPTDVAHVPRVLCHCDARSGVRGAMAARVAEAEAAVVARSRRAGGRVSVDQRPPYGYVLDRTGGERPPIDVIVPTRDRLDLLRPCVDGVLERTDYPSIHLCIVDNGSTDPATIEYLDELARSGRAAVLARPGPFNFSRLVNEAVGHTASPLVCLLNNDIEVLHPEWLDELVAHALRSEVGAVGPLLLFPDGRVQHAGVVTGLNGIASHPYRGASGRADGYFGGLRLVQNYSALTAACMVFRREHFAAVGGFDERMSVCYNDVDFCLELRRQGLHNVWSPSSRLRHVESASRGKVELGGTRMRHRIETRHMVNKWGRALLLDHAYNPNLALEGDGFDLALPCRSQAPRSA